MPSCLTVLFLSSVFDFLVSAVLTGAVTASACRHDGSCALHGALGQTPERELHLKRVIVRTQTQSLVFHSPLATTVAEAQCAAVMVLLATLDPLTPFGVNTTLYIW